MNITDVRVRKVFPVGKVKAIVSITIDNAFAVHGLKIIEVNGKTFVAMPNKKITISEDGKTIKGYEFKDTAHPINQETRAMIETLVLDAYDQYIQHAIDNVM